MRAVVCESYGAPDEALELAELEKPKPEIGEAAVLVRVHAASLNRIDWYGVIGRPLFSRLMLGFRKPKERRVGLHFAGTVEAVGKGVRDLAPGEEVFGGATGTLAEYVCVTDDVARKPRNSTMEEAATLPGARAALQALRDAGRLQPGQTVLVNGASGGVGTFAVQIAKALGGVVTAVCSTQNVERARALGADHVVDYTEEDFTRGDAQYDLILDVAGSKRWSDYKRVLGPNGRLVIFGAPATGPLLGPMGPMLRLKLASILGKATAVFFVAKPAKEDLDVLRQLAESGKVKPVVDRTYR